MLTVPKIVASSNCFIAWSETRSGAPSAICVANVQSAKVFEDINATPGGASISAPGDLNSFKITAHGTGATLSYTNGGVPTTKEFTAG